MSAVAYTPPFEQPCRCDCQAKLSAVAAILQNPNLTHKQARIRAGSVLALEAQRPAENPRAPFRVNLGELAKRSGLIPPTPDGHEGARARAWTSGRKQAGQAIKELAEAGAFEQYIRELERGDDGMVTASSVIVQMSASHLELIRIAARMDGNRKLQQPRGRSARIDPRCPECGSDDTRLQCRTCGAITETRELVSAVIEHEANEPAESTDFQRLEIHSNEDTEGGGETAFQRLETHDGEEPTSVDATGFQSLETGEGQESVCPATDEPGMPPELLSKPQWVAHSGDKVPIDPSTDKGADPTDPTTWATYDEARTCAVRLCLPGAGYALHGEEVGIDLDTRRDKVTGEVLDRCRDPVTGKIEPWAWEIVTEMNSYTEVSPSGEGLHIIVRGKKPGDHCRTVVNGHKIEMYDRERYFTMTGRHVVGTPTRVEERSPEVATLYRRIFPDARPAASNGHARSTGSVSDEELLRRVRQGRTRERFDRLWRGDWSDKDSPSEADDELCRLLAFCGADANQIDAFWRESGLAAVERGSGREDAPHKWERYISAWGMTYGEHTIQRAIESALAWGRAP